jgi:hypothetical protein
MKSPLNELFSQSVLMLQEVSLVVAVEGHAELTLKVIGKAKGGVRRCILWVDCETLVVKSNCTVEVPKWKII